MAWHEEKSRTVVGSGWCEQNSTWEKAGAGATGGNRENGLQNISNFLCPPGNHGHMGKGGVLFCLDIKENDEHRRQEDLRLFGSQ